jgi:AcrR family transcriptional regulator
MSTVASDPTVRRCELVFEAHGFHGASMDALVRAAGVSSRTLYKRHGSKQQLILAVLRIREDRFFASLSDDGVNALFDGLALWVEREGGRGCMFLRALGEFGDREGPIMERVAAYHARLRGEIAARIARQREKMPPAKADGGAKSRDGSHDVDPALVERILILFEGAAAVGAYRGPDAARQAGQAASELLAARSRPCETRDDVS